VLDDVAPRAPGPIAVGRVARRGMAWMLLGTIVTKIASVLAQLILAWLLAPKDFGLYAAAIGVAGFITAFSDAGVPTYLVRHGRSQYASLAAPVFWLALTVNSIAAALLVGVGVAIGVWRSRAGGGSDSPFAHPEFPGLLFVIALSMPLATPGGITRTLMRLDLRFGELSALTAVLALCRYVGSTILALLGAGAQSFVLPMLLVAIVQWVWTQISTRDQCWIGPPAFARWPGILRETRWLLLGTLGSVIYSAASYFCVALFVSAATVGVFFFAYQMTQQVGALVTTNTQAVLAPVFVHIRDQEERLREAALRTLRVLMVFAVPLMLGLAVVFDPMERAFLGGRWREAVVPVMVFGALTPLALTWGLTASIYNSTGRFKQWALGSIGEGAFVTAGSALGAVIGGSALSISIASACCVCVSRLLFTLHSMKVLGVRPAAAIGTCLGAWAIGLVCAPAAILIADLLAGRIPVLAFFARGLVFCAMFAVGTRLILPSSIVDALSMAPARWQKVFRRAIRLRTSETDRAFEVAAVMKGENAHR